MEIKFLLQSETKCTTGNCNDNFKLDFEIRDLITLHNYCNPLDPFTILIIKMEEKIDMH